MSDFASRLVARSVGPVGLRPAARPRFAAGGVAEVAVETPAAIPAAPPAAIAPRSPRPIPASFPSEAVARHAATPLAPPVADPLVEMVTALPAREARPGVPTAERVVIERHTAEVRSHERTVQERSRTVERERELTRVVAPAEPVVRVTIGRVEVRAERPSEPSRKRVQPAAPMTSLSDYAPGTRR